MAIENESLSIKEKRTWTADDQPKISTTSHSHYLENEKKSDSNMDRFNAPIGAGGNFKVFGQDYFESCAPLFSFSVVRRFLLVALSQNMSKKQIDVKAAF